MITLLSVAFATPPSAVLSTPAAGPSATPALSLPAGPLSTPDSVDYVVGGTPAPAGSWPSTAAIIEQGYGVVCTGTLITPTVVMTAGHCVTPYVPTEVRLNSVDGTTGGELIQIASVTAHPDYVANESTDIAVIQLATPASTPPATIAADCRATETLYDGAPTMIVGFGATDANASVYTQQMYEVLSVIHDADCSQDVSNGVQTGCEPSLRPMAGELMAGGNGVDSCNGDSGGPLYTQALDGSWYVAGVTSRGVLSGSACGNGGVYMRPDSWIPWMESIVGPIPRPTCTVPTPPAPTPDPDPVDDEQDEQTDDTVDPVDDAEDDAPTGRPDTRPDPSDEPADEPVVEGPPELHGGELFVQDRGIATIELEMVGLSVEDVDFAIVLPPAHGQARITNDGLMAFAHTGGGAIDLVRVAATDADGNVYQADVLVSVLGARGCSSTGGAPLGFGAALAGLIALFGRRR